jgi:hypothetical protein
MRTKTAFLTLLFALGVCGNSRLASDEKSIVAYAKAIDVASLDPALRTERLDKWLRRGPARLDTIVFTLSDDCDTKRDPGTKEPSNGWPVCVRVNFEKEHILSGWIMLSVGTSRKGISGQPQFNYAAAHLQDRLPLVGEVERMKLSGVPKMVDRLLQRAKTPK